MLIEKLKRGDNFTNHEREVAQYILKNADKVPGMSSAELAEASFTSKATVVRLSQKLGLTGYQELRLKLVEEINQKNRISQMLKDEPVNEKSTYTDSVLFTTQIIIVSRELDRKKHVWLRALSEKMEKQDMEELLKK